MSAQKPLTVRGARAHNLTGIDLSLPQDRLILITGVSGSGKSSLAFDTLFKEGERRYFATLSERARALFTKIGRPEATAIDGVRPAIAVDQRASVRSPRSTVGTLSELGDGLRLLFARFSRRPCEDCGEAREVSKTECECGASVAPLTRAHFSFNSEKGACPSCRGLGLEDRVDPALLVADPQKSLREGAMVPTLPGGYIVYSQVTPDSMNIVCKAHGFDIDTPWHKLTEAQRRVIFFGSDRVKVPFGKHTLESRMKWSGIKAKPRSTGHYRGLVNVLNETLVKSRNDNVMRFVRTRACSACEGTRLSAQARLPKLGDFNLAQLNASAVQALGDTLTSLELPPAAQSVLHQLQEKCARLSGLGLGHLALDRPSASRSGGEARRLRLAQQLGMELTGLLYVLDEPSAGAHLSERDHLAQRVRALAAQGNTVVVVEHDPAFYRWAEHVVQIGPGAGSLGGRLLHQGPPEELPPLKLDALSKKRPPSARKLHLKGARARNLQRLDVELQLGALNVISGVSGSGKTSLLEYTLARALRAMVHNTKETPGAHDALQVEEPLRKVLLVSQGEIGRSPRSNPATYSGVFDPIRALFAAQPEALGLSKGHFSFNKKGGRCERCEGAGVEVIGMMSLPAVNLTCEACEGQRFLPQTLKVKVKGRSILQVLQTTVAEARELFKDHPKIAKILEAMHTVGLGYLPLGQPATTLSGGEGQRLKLAKELARSDGRGTVLLLDEPCSGLHPRDVRALIVALNQLIAQGATVIMAEHDPRMLLAADHVLDLGPGAGPKGGKIVFSGTPQALLKARDSRTGTALLARAKGSKPAAPKPVPAPQNLQLSGVRTHNLRSVDARFDFSALTVVTGRSGSGKSSLVFRTLAAEGRQRFAQSVAPFLRREIRSAHVGDFEEARGLRASVVFQSRNNAVDPRSTVGTRAKLDGALRLLFARMTQDLSASHFSFNHALGACAHCHGRGSIKRCDPARLVPDPERSIAQGALSQSRAGRLLFELEGKNHAILLALLKAHKLSPDLPYFELPPKARAKIERGEDTPLNVLWEHAKQEGEAKHTFEAPWPGALTLIEQTWAQKRGRKVEPLFEALLSDQACPNCQGERIGDKARAVRWGPHRLPELRAMTLARLQETLTTPGPLSDREAAVLEQLRPQLHQALSRLNALGLSYLCLDRATASLSSGERGRLDLATQLIEGLQGACYVLDEPCAGLHDQDRQALASALKSLAKLGNVVIAVEHDETLIRAADRVIDLGPGAGAQGGRVVAQGPLEEVLATPQSLTGRYLSGAQKLQRAPTADAPRGGISVAGAHARNLQHVDLQVPFGALLGICGVSGSGKSTLMFEVLARSLESGQPHGCSRVDGAAQVVRVQASSVALGPQRTVATFLGLLEPLAKQFAKALGLKKNTLMYTSRAGQCPKCQGSGQERVSLDFLPDALSPCDECLGDRFAPEVRTHAVDGRTLPQLLSLEVSALAAQPKLPAALLQKVQLLNEVGLGHLSLSRSCESLSSGERQRLHIASAIAPTPSQSQPKVFLFDEPARGLHFSDQQLLLDLFGALTSAGHAVVFCEHALRLLACADRLVELGPGGGPQGGSVIFEGPPSALRDAKTPTGLALAGLRL